MDTFSFRVHHLNIDSRRQNGVFFLVLALMSVAVYWKFIFKIQAFVFVDIGDDSFYQTIPILMNRARTLFSDFGFARYNINLCLGQFETNLNLTDTFLALFGEKNVVYMTGVFQALKTFLSGVFFYSFTREHKLDYKACVLTSLGYAFNGAMLTRLAFFSYSNEYMFVALSLYALELLYRRGNKWLFPLASALLVQSFDAVRAIFYFLFFAVYTVFRCVLDEERPQPGAVIKRTLQVMGMQLLGYAMVAALILPGYIDLAGSSRLASVSSNFFSSTPEIISGNAIITSFFRLFSNEILGSAAHFSGRNTYVCGPAFVTGIMNVLIIPQIMVHSLKKNRIMYLLAAGAIFAYLLFAPLRQIMNGFAYDRFKLTSFWITIIMLYVAAIVWDRFFRENVFNRSLFLVTGGGVLAVLFALKYINILNVDRTAFIITVTLIIASMLAVFAVSVKKSSLFSLFLIAVLVVDLVINSYTSVDHRETLSTAEYESSYLASGIHDLAASLKESETDYFRICNFDSSYSGLRCDGQANDYLSTSTYDGGAGVSNEYNRFAGLVGGDLIRSTGYRSFANNDFMTMLPVQTLLGVRYLVYDKTTVPAAPVVPYGYTLFEQDGYWVLKNEYALPLAIAFDSVISASDVENMGQIERRETLLSSAMVENGSALLSSDLAVASAPERDVYALLAESAIPLTQETESFVAEDETEVTRATATLERPVDADYALVYAKIASTKGTNEGVAFTVSWAGADGVFTSANSMWYSMPSGQNELLLELPICGAQYVRIDAGGLQTSVSFASVSEAGEDYFASYNEAVAHLQEHAFTFTRLDNHVLEGTIMLDNPALLTFTFLTDSGWSATVNGEPVEIELVDGGFMGVYLNEGTNQVKLSYRVSNIGIYAGISAVAFVGYTLLLVLSSRRRKKNAPHI